MHNMHRFSNALELCRIVQGTNARRRKAPNESIVGTGLLFEQALVKAIQTFKLLLQVSTFKLPVQWRALAASVSESVEVPVSCQWQ